MTAAAPAPPPADRFALVRDRELADLIEALDATIDVITIVARTGDEREGKFIYATLNKAVDVLSELRQARS